MIIICVSFLNHVIINGCLLYWKKRQRSGKNKSYGDIFHSFDQDSQRYL